MDVNMFEAKPWEAGRLDLGISGRENPRVFPINP